MLGDRSVSDGWVERNFYVFITKAFSFVNCVPRLFYVRLSPVFQGLLIFRRCQNYKVHCHDGGTF